MAVLSGCVFSGQIGETAGGADDAADVLGVLRDATPSDAGRGDVSTADFGTSRVADAADARSDAPPPGRDAGPASPDAGLDADAGVDPEVGPDPDASVEPAMCPDGPAICEPIAGGAVVPVAVDDNPAALRFDRYAPPGDGGATGLVTVLHGCGQSVANARLAGWDALADAHGFHVLYPEHPSLCWRWALTADRDREARSIRAAVEQEAATLGVPPAQRFVAGFGAGGAQVMVMLAEAPGVFAAAATVAAVPYDCGAANAEAFCLLGQADRTADEWAQQVRAAGGPGAPPPRISLWHGTGDLTIGVGNLQELTEQWLSLHDLPAADAEACDAPDGATHEIWRAGDGRVAVERWTLESDGHGVFVDPDNDCGAAGVSHIDVGVSFAAGAARFFGWADP
jgi:poly(hydroxyalkanoate) depolymerase family esterase